MNAPPLLADAAFCAALPKAELHLHIEGTLTPAQKLTLARRHRHAMASMTLEQIEQTHHFGGSGSPEVDLKQMLDCYYGGIELLSTRSDFFDTALAYLDQCHREGVRYAEISFDPQAHTSRGVPMADVVVGLYDALQYGRATWGVQAQLILCINRDRSVDSALATLDEAAPYRECGWIVGLGGSRAESAEIPADVAAWDLDPAGDAVTGTLRLLRRLLRRHRIALRLFLAQQVRLLSGDSRLLCRSLACQRGTPWRCA